MDRAFWVAPRESTELSEHAAQLRLVKRLALSDNDDTHVQEGSDSLAALVPRETTPVLHVLKTSEVRLPWELPLPKLIGPGNVNRRCVTVGYDMV